MLYVRATFSLCVGACTSIIEWGMGPRSSGLHTLSNGGYTCVGTKAEKVHVQKKISLTNIDIHSMILKSNNLTKKSLKFVI